MNKPSLRVRNILSKMSIQEKVDQLSCMMPMVIMENEKVSESKIKENYPRLTGRMTQFASGFFSGPISAAEGYNTIQKYAIEETDAKIPVLIQNETLAGLVAP